MKTKNKIWLTAIALLMLVFQAAAQTTTVNGLVVVVNFKDYKLNATIPQLEDMFNKPTGFNLWGNETSVREYFKVQTNNKIDLINTIISVDLDQNSTYYVGNGAPGDLAYDVIAAINQKYPNGFSGLTEHPTQGRLYNFSMISKSLNGAGVAWGTEAYIQNNGVPMRIANVSHVSWKTDFTYDVNTICHEYGHSVWNWTDYYRSAFCNLGMFNVMASAGSTKGAMPINPALRLQRGWIDTVTNIQGNITATYSIQANNYSRVFRYVNPANPKEYLIFQALKHDKFYQSDLYGTPTPEGLAIWYVDEQTGFGLPDQDGQNFIRLVQADNLDQMHDEDAPASVRGDMNDLYGNGNNSFPNGHPMRWKDGGEFGITLSNITKSGNVVNFTVNGRTRTVLGVSDVNGTLSPKGTINVTTGTSQAFTFIPDPGYELVDLLVDDMSVPFSNPYTLTGIGTTPKTIQPIFDKKVTIAALPTPWQKASIGVTGLAEYNTATTTFGLEAEGGALSGTNDYFTYVYQTLTGNGTIIARVASWNKPNWNHRAGIMIRESLQGNSAQTMLVKGAYDGHKIEQRTASGNHLQSDPNNVGNMHQVNLYNWLKITREGNVFTSYCSRDGIIWTPLAQQTINMPNQLMFGLCVTGGVQYFPAKASFDHVSVTNSVQAGCTVTSGTKITGTSIGTVGSWNESGATRDKAFDGNIFTDFDAPTGDAWTGLSLNTNYRVTGIRYLPRKKSMDRMVGGKFQGSNTADFSSGVVDLAAITTEPAYEWTCISVTNTSSFAYIRYVGPDGGHGNVTEVEFYGTVQNNNQAPTVTITYPATNASFTGAKSVTITANATDTDGSISRVDFYRGSTLLGSDNTAPYSFFVSSIPAGVYNFTALAIDNQSASASHTVNNIAFIANPTPTVNITSPVTNTSFAAPASITINATASIVTGSIWKVDFYNGATWLGSDLTAPYTYTWNNVPAGTYTISAKATDYLGETSTHTVNNIAVVTNTPPTVSITSPVTNANYAAPANITINVTATDADGSITKVDFYNGSTLLGSDLTAPYSFVWNNVPVGVYNITALAIDNFGASASNTRNNIAVVANTPPTVSITSPVTNASFTAPANITINVAATDADGSITKVDFYNGSTLLGSDLTAPYSFAWNNVPAGVYNITALAIDNLGASASNTRNNIAVAASTADITGPACASNNTTITFELSAAKRANVTGYGWYFTGSTQTFTPSSVNPYQVTLVTGNNFGAGQLCVGVNLNTAPWYTTYCITVPKCSTTREANSEEWTEVSLETKSVGFPNPFTSETTINLANSTQTATIQVYNAQGVLVQEAVASSTYTFGQNLVSGIYFVKINTESKTETLKFVKE